MSRVQYQQKFTENNSSFQPSQQTQQRRQNNDRTYNNQNRSYKNNYNSKNNYNNDRKPRYQDKERGFKNRFGFDYDESKIGYNTEIPEMPEKPKQQPDQAKYTKKVEDLRQKQTELKRLRREKKHTYKNGSKQFTDQIDEQKKNIDLAKACLVILNYDKETIEQDLQEIENKIAQHKRKVDNLSKPVQKGLKNVKLEDMSYSELVREEERIQQQMSVRSMTKAQEVQYSNQLNKIKKRKIEVPKQAEKSAVSDARSDSIQSHKNAIENLKNIKNGQTDKVTDIENKILSIEDDIQDFEEKIEQIHIKLKNTDNSKLLEEAAELKQQIYAIWDELKQLQDQHIAKIKEYEYEQEMIKYIQWAKQTKAKKAEQWELEKQERKRQRLKEKEHTKKNKDQKAPKQGQKKQGQTVAEQKPQFQRKKINKNQKQIDSCAFLIQYCKDLGKGSNKCEQKHAEKEVKLEEELKKGEWAKLKNVEVIKSKKSKVEEEAQQKTYKKKEHKNVVPQASDRFSHSYFVAQVFDSVKVLPPTKSEDLEKVINELEDKMEYYIAHPDEGVEKSILPTRQAERDTKTRAPRKIINTEEFPSLK